MNRIFNIASKISAIPGLNAVSPAGDVLPGKVELAGYHKAQTLAQDSVREIAKLMQPGWSEEQTADMINTFLRDSGVQSFFHKAFVWYGQRTRFEGVKKYKDYLPTQRILQEGDVVILDVAPIVDGYICDIGYTVCKGENQAYETAREFLLKLRKDLPKLFIGRSQGGQIWESIDQRIIDAGYDNIHSLYPFSVLGHRVHHIGAQKPEFNFINFGWQSYWSLLSRGLFGQLLNKNYAGNLTGLWAIEPHIGTPDFGAKFEEILVVEEDNAYWLESKPRLLEDPDYLH